jgi:uncharacterized protein
VNKELEEYCRHIKNEDYFEAHEALEPLWLETKKRDHDASLPLKALINAAIAFEHIKRAKPSAKINALNVFKGYTKYREEVALSYHEIYQLIEQIATKLQLL